MTWGWVNYQQKFFLKWTNPLICNVTVYIHIFRFFCITTAVFGVTWSFRNHSNMLICCLRNIFNILNISVKLWNNFCFKLLWWIEGSYSPQTFKYQMQKVNWTVTDTTTRHIFSVQLSDDFGQNKQIWRSSGNIKSKNEAIIISSIIKHHIVVFLKIGTVVLLQCYFSSMVLF